MITPRSQPVNLSILTVVENCGDITYLRSDDGFLFMFRDKQLECAYCGRSLTYGVSRLIPFNFSRWNREIPFSLGITPYCSHDETPPARNVQILVPTLKEWRRLN